MLSKDEITHLISNPENISSDVIQHLEQLALKYPYTQLFSILLLKGLKQHKDISFEEKLAKHSYFVSDRVQLYKLVNSEFDLEIETEQDDTIKETLVSDIVKEEVIDTIEKETEVTNSETQLEEGNIQSEETNSLLDWNPLMTEEIIISVTEEEEEETTTDNLEDNILQHAFAANFQLEDLSLEEEEKLETINLKSSNQKQIDREKEEQLSKINDTESSFTNWLHSNTNFNAENSTEKDKIEAVVNDFKDFDPSSELFGELKKPKTEFFSPIKKAKESLAENALPVSETLAKIYTLQGNYPKAISAYEQLSLIYPEKKIFFANLIIDLKKKINTK